MADEIPQCNKPKLPEIERATDLLEDTTIEIPPEIIQGVLHKGLKAVLGSNSKACKTWILLDLALSVATGTCWWKWPTIKSKVLYINFEIPRAFIYRRLKSLCEKKDFIDSRINSPCEKKDAIDSPINSLCEKEDQIDLRNLDVWNLRGKAAPLGNLEAELVSKIKAGGYSLVIIDPIYKGLGGRDENSAGDIGQLCNELERIAVQTEAAVFYVAHFSKGNQAGKEAIDRISGSGVWARDADTIITLTKHKEEQANAYTVDLILRNLPEQEPFVVAWEYPLMILREDLDPEDLKQARGRKPIFDEADLLNVLGSDRLSTKEWQQRSQTEGISASSFYRLYKLLKKSGRIVKGEDEKWAAQPEVVSSVSHEAPGKETEKVLVN